MGIPIIDEIVSSFRWLVDFFVNKVPKPVTFLIFLLFLTIFATFFSVMLHMVGIHCNSEGIAEKTAFTSLFTNYNIMTAGQEKFNISSYQPSEVTDSQFNNNVEVNCLYAVCLKDNATMLDNEFYEYEHPDCVGKPKHYLYRLAGGTSLGINFGCVECDYISGFKATGINFLGFEETDTFGKACYSDAYLPLEYNWYQSMTCRDFWSCKIPEGYYWSNETGAYTCLDNEICGENLTNSEILYNVDFLLKEAGAVPIYVVGKSEDDYTSFVGIKCDSNYNPELTIFKIPIFNYQIWVLIMIIYILIMVLFYARGK
jgi:hypothetical protein